MQIFVEYVMLAGVNDGPQQAHELGRLLRPRHAQYMVNLIPWNPVYSPGIAFEAPGNSSLTAFHDTVRSYSIQCTIRREMGQDISGVLLCHTTMPAIARRGLAVSKDCCLLDPFACHSQQLHWQLRAAG